MKALDEYRQGYEDALAKSKGGKPISDVTELPIRVVQAVTDEAEEFAKSFFESDAYRKGQMDALAGKKFSPPSEEEEEPSQSNRQQERRQQERRQEPVQSSSSDGEIDIVAIFYTVVGIVALGLILFVALIAVSIVVMVLTVVFCTAPIWVGMPCVAVLIAVSLRSKILAHVETTDLSDVEFNISEKKGKRRFSLPRSFLKGRLRHLEDLLPIVAGPILYAVILLAIVCAFLPEDESVLVMLLGGIAAVVGIYFSYRAGQQVLLWIFGAEYTKRAEIDGAFLKTKWIGATSIAVLVVILTLGTLGYFLVRSPGKDDLRTYLAGQIEDQIPENKGVEITVDEVKRKRITFNEFRVQAEATIKTTKPLYAPVDSREVLIDSGLPKERMAEARKIRANLPLEYAVGADPEFKATIVREAVPGGAIRETPLSLTVVFEDGEWMANDLKIENRDALSFEGRQLDSYESEALLADSAEAKKAIDQHIVDIAAFVSSVETMNQQYQADLEAERLRKEEEERKRIAELEAQRKAEEARKLADLEEKKKESERQQSADLTQYSTGNILKPNTKPLFTAGVATLQNTINLAVVDLKQVFEEYRKTKQADTTLKRQLDTFKSERDRKLSAYRTLVDKLKRMKSGQLRHTPSEYEREFALARKYEKELKEFEDTTAKILKDKSASLRAPLVADIKSEIQNVSSGTYNIVLDISADSRDELPYVLYHHGIDDITEFVIDNLNNGKSLKPSSGGASRLNIAIVNVEKLLAKNGIQEDMRNERERVIQATRAYAKGRYNIVIDVSGNTLNGASFLFFSGGLPDITNEIRL
jgi:Skp family chaperone for outer membrane proteins